MHGSSKPSHFIPVNLEPAILKVPTDKSFRKITDCLLLVLLHYFSFSQKIAEYRSLQ